MEHTQAFQQQISDLIPKLNTPSHQMVTTTTTNNTTIHHTHNTQNTFNLNIFLNEKCKDAWNMSDFIDSLKVTIDDLMVTRERGIGESIGRILVQGLSTLDIYKRPIHCTDLKRDTMYVKDKEVWESQLDTDGIVQHHRFLYKYLRRVPAHLGILLQT